MPYRLLEYKKDEKRGPDGDQFYVVQTVVNSHGHAEIRFRMWFHSWFCAELCLRRQKGEI